MHKLMQLIKDVDKTHPHLGQLAAIEVVAVKAQMCSIIVSPPSFGKSKVMEWLAATLADRCIYYPEITLASLQYEADKLSNSNKIVLIDDLGSANSDYIRTETLSTLATLTYSHKAGKHTHKVKFNIENFQGCALMNVQPRLINNLMKTDNWDANVRDKSIRIYHYWRTAKSQSNDITAKFDLGLPIEDVKLRHFGTNELFKLTSYAGFEWTDNRLAENIPALLRSIAGIDNRRIINTTDIKLLTKLIAPFYLENYLQVGGDMAGGSGFDYRKFYLIAELASFDEPTVEKITHDWRISRDWTDTIIEKYKDICIKKDKSPVLVALTDEGKEILRRIGAYNKW